MEEYVKYLEKQLVQQGKILPGAIVYGATPAAYQEPDGPCSFCGKEIDPALPWARYLQGEHTTGYSCFDCLNKQPPDAKEANE